MCTQTVWTHTNLKGGIIMRKTKIVVSSIMAAALMLGCTCQAFADGPESRYKDGLKNGLVNGLKNGELK